ncbi:MAG: acetyltransferase [Chitinophagaceae bacterium]
MKSNKPVFVVGYSGHALVVLDVFYLNQQTVVGYCDVEEKKDNPFNIQFLGSEKEVHTKINNKEVEAFIAIGHNNIRIKVAQTLLSNGFLFANAIHPKATVSTYANLSSGVLVSANASINAMAIIGEGVVCNTGCVIEHECNIGNYTHIAPGAVICGNVQIGNNCFIGANAVIKQGVVIEDNVTIGAGSTIISNISANTTVVGNPQRTIEK